MGSIAPALPIGVVAGLRSMLAPAAVSWAARSHSPSLRNTPLAFLGYPAIRWLLTGLAVAELIGDKLPGAPSRKSPVAFGGRLATGAFSGAAIGIGRNSALGGLAGGVMGAALGTLGGFAARRAVARRLGADWQAALIEDAFAAGLLVGALR